jgi:hypothetical protein
MRKENFSTLTRSLSGLLVYFSLVLGCYGAVLPDLNGSLNGLEKANPGTSCFDPKQPWYVCFVIGNFHHFGSAPVAPAGPFTLKLEIMNGPSLNSAIIKTVSKDVTAGLNAGALLEVCFHLPASIDHNDLGVKHAFRLTIDSPLPNGQVVEDDETNNVVEFGNGSAVPMATDSSLPQAPAPDKNVKIIDTAAIPGDAHDIKVRIKNLGAIDSKLLVMFLTVHKGMFGAVPGVSDNLNGIKVPPIPPKKSIWVTIGSNNNEAFVQPTSKAKSNPPGKATQPLIARTVAGNTAIISSVKKGGLFGIGKRRDLIVNVAPPPDYKVLIPFTLDISGTDQKITFGAPPIPSGGAIKIPGKK